MENTLFDGFSTGLQPQNHPVAVGGILMSSKLAPIFTRLEFAGLFYLMCFAGESPGYASLKSGHHTSACCGGIGPASGSISANHASHSAAVAKKN
jgi:hypothetical protein